jgi:hypothetical protein
MLVHLMPFFLSKGENTNRAKNVRRRRTIFSPPGEQATGIWSTNSVYNGHTNLFRFRDLRCTFHSTVDIRTKTCDISRFCITRFFNHDQNLLFHVRLYSWRRWTEACKQQTLPNDGGICIAVSSALIQSNTNRRSAQVQVLVQLSYQSARSTAGTNVAVPKHRIHQFRKTTDIIFQTFKPRVEMWDLPLVRLIRQASGLFASAFYFQISLSVTPPPPTVGSKIPISIRTQRSATMKGILRYVPQSLKYSIGTAPLFTQWLFLPQLCQLNIH